MHAATSNIYAPSCVASTEGCACAADPSALLNSRACRSARQRLRANKIGRCACRVAPIRGRIVGRRCGHAGARAGAISQAGQGLSQTSLLEPYGKSNLNASASAGSRRLTEAAVLPAAQTGNAFTCAELRLPSIGPTPNSPSKNSSSASCIAATLPIRFCRRGRTRPWARAACASSMRAHAVQPQVSFNGRLAVSFNGEIYNHDELRRDLVRPRRRVQDRIRHRGAGQRAAGLGLSRAGARGRHVCLRRARHPERRIPRRPRSFRRQAALCHPVGDRLPVLLGDGAAAEHGRERRRHAAAAGLRALAQDRRPLQLAGLSAPRRAARTTTSRRSTRSSPTRWRAACRPVCRSRRCSAAASTRR